MFNPRIVALIVNARGILAVTGDYGNWIFCREFHPSKKEFASDYYWLEKLKIHSVQEGEEFDSEKTIKDIQEQLKDLEDYGYTDAQFAEVKEYLVECLRCADLTEQEYTSFAYNNYPSFLDPEDIPMCRSMVYRMFYILDAFDEMCRRENDFN